MDIVLTVLKVIGLILLVLLVILLFLLLIVLFVPVRYSASASYDDPVPHDDILPEDPLNRFKAELHMSWMRFVLTVAAVYPGDKKLTVKVFGRDFPLDRFFKKKEKKEEPGEKKEQAPRPKKSLLDRLEAIPDKIDNLIYKKDYYLRLFQSTYGQAAVNDLLARIVYVLNHYLPEEWVLGGTLGAGTPLQEGKVLELIGYTMPVTAGHLVLTPEFYHYIYDLKFAAEGRVRVFVAVRAGAALLLNKNFRRFIRMLRKGPPSQEKAMARREAKEAERAEKENAA